MVFDSFFNAIFLPVVNLVGAAATVIFVSFLLTALVTWVYKLVTNQALMKEMKEEIKSLQGQMKEQKDNHEKMMEIQKKAMEKNLQYMKHSFKPTFFTLIPLLIIFGWLRTTFTPYGDLFYWGFWLPLFGTGISWLGTYILSSILFSMIIRKIFKIY